jgi:ribosome-associated protein
MAGGVRLGYQHAMIRITDAIALDERELEEAFIRSSGPGGQNVNKVATAVQLRLDLRHSPSLPEEVRTRAEKLAGRRLTDEGILVIDARRFRTQERNRADAMERLVRLLRQAATPPRRRRATRPPAASRKARLDAKRRRAAVKGMRRPPAGED